MTPVAAPQHDPSPGGASMTPATAPQPAEPPEHTRRGLIRDIGVNAVAPYATYLGLSAYGVDTVWALVAGAVFPIAGVLVGAIRQRRVQAIGIIVLTATAASVASALWFTSPFLALARGAVMTALMSVVLLASLPMRRPLLFHLANAGLDAAGRQEAEAEWAAEPELRRMMWRLTAIWGVALLAETALSLVVIVSLPVAAVIPVNEVLFWACFGALAFGSYKYGQRVMGPG